ncbi:hypothetical protein TSUD_285720 [Trifolium subterraneum]|uniref:Retrotransposon gag domain-containing protein n=1 Tax=Trifolium subterraneum TaxID=3900 RepID=A0A2Z6NTU2_TRISU|nr:hypothetical protein TSUD_285720 [Trifolium subterraneum]
MQGRKKVVRELLFDHEIEKTAKANRKAVRLARQAARLASGTRETSEEEGSSSHTLDDETESMAGVVQLPRRTLGDYGQATDGQNPNMGFQPVNPVSFDIKNTVLSALKENQFSGGESECPNIHLSRFYEACGYTGPIGLSESNKRLRLFPIFLTGRAKDWIDTLPPNTIATWDKLELKFRDRYFPIHKFLERKNEITNFEQRDSESLYDAWERFKLCLKKCPKHGIYNVQMQHFTQGLRAHTRMLLDASTGGSLKNKDESEAKVLVEAMAQNEYRVQNDKGAKKNALRKQCTCLTSKRATPTITHTRTLTIRVGQNIQILVGGGNQNQSQQQASSQNSQPRKPSQLEDALAQFIKVTQGNFEEMKISQNQLKVNQEQMKSNQDIANKNHEASIKSLETRIGQLSRQFAVTQHNGFEGSTRDNPRNKSCMVVNLRSREVSSPEVVSKKKMAESDNESDEVVEHPREKKIDKENHEKLVEKKKGKGVEEKEGQKEKENLVHAKLPYPRKKKAKEEDPQQFKKFMKMLHILQMNIPFAKALEQMPVYAKFIKELLTKKRKPLDDDTVNMTEECSAIIQKKLPQKKKDPGSFTIPCSIRNLHVFEATKFGGPVPECFKVDVLEEVVNDAQEEEWDHEIELFLQHLDDDREERETLHLEGTLIVKELKKDDDALVWGRTIQFLSFACPRRIRRKKSIRGLKRTKVSFHHWKVRLVDEARIPSLEDVTMGWYHFLST